MWENEINYHDVYEIRAKSTVYLGIGAIQKMDHIAQELKRRGADRLILITGKNSYKTCGAYEVVLEALQKHDIPFIHYDGVMPNPTVEQVDMATRLAIQFNAKAVLAIGGGSPIDAAKGVAILSAPEYQGKTAQELYEFQFFPSTALPLVTINLTHGTGTEIDRFSVVTIPEKLFKPAIGYDCIYPLYSINDPALMVNLPANQTRYVSLDALNHVIEAATTIVASPFSIDLAHRTVDLVARYLPLVLEDPKNLKARFYLTYAAMIAGVSFDNGLLHFTHSLEHPLSAVKPELPHGLGLAMILPAVLKTIYPAKAKVLSSLLSPIIPHLSGEISESSKVASSMEEWIFKVGCPFKLQDEGFKEEDISKLTHLAMHTPMLDVLLSMAPVKATPEVVSSIYRDSLKTITP